MSNWVMKLLLALCAGCYAGAFVCSLERFEKKLRPAWKWVFTGSALALNTGLVVYNYIINRITNGASYAPFVSMFQVLIFLALTFTPVWLFVEKVCRYKGYHWYFLLASAIVMLGPCFMDIHAVWTFPPALQSVFFVPHVICYMLSYSLAAIAFLIAFVSLFSGKNEEGVCACCVRTLLPFMSAGMFLGAVWADQVWGEFWAWDIKECWSLCTWLDYMLCLHCYRRENLRKYAKILVFTGFLLVIITFLFSNVLKVSSTHSYS